MKPTWYVGGVEDESDQAYGIKYYRSVEQEFDPKKNMECRSLKPPRNSNPFPYYLQNKFITQKNQNRSINHLLITNRNTTVHNTPTAQCACQM